MDDYLGQHSGVGRDRAWESALVRSLRAKRSKRR
jgi:hypothetical protein